MSSGKPVTIAILDDNLMVREALSRLLGTLPDLKVTFAGAAESPELTRKQPDVILLDTGLSDRDSMNVVTTLRVSCPASRIVMMDLLPSSDEVREYVNAGVAGFALKDASFEEFVATIRTVAAGQNVLPARMTESLFSQIAREAADTEKKRVIEDIRMTPRELDVIAIIGEGLSNKEIAQRLNIATHTVKSHVRNVMEKLALHSRLQIAAHVHRMNQP
jgi:DNA-binding NarL/FixJ family response regulator